MQQAYATSTKLPNLGGAKTCTKNPETCTPSALQVAITEVIKTKFPKGTKPWAFLADLFSLKERAAKHRLANAVSYTIEELQALIQGEDGLEYLKALMADAEPAWWSWAQWVMEQAKLRRVAAEANQQSLQLEARLPLGAVPSRRKGNNDAKNLSATFARKETAIGLLAPQHDRSLDRAMVQTQGQASRSGGRR